MSVYTEETANAITEAKNSVIRGKNITEQSIVDGYAEAIENAIAALEYKGADYFDVDKAIAKIPTDLNVYTEETANAVTEAKNSVIRGKNITEQSIVDGYAEAIENAIAALELKIVVPNTPEIISGANQIVEHGQSAEFISDSDFANFLKVLINGKEISSDNYTVKEGSTIVTLKADFIKTLDTGKHTINIVSTDGQADAEFSVVKSSASEDEPNDESTDESTDESNDESNDESTSPQTGDNSNVFRGVFLLISSAAILVITIYGIRTRRYRTYMK